MHQWTGLWRINKLQNKVLLWFIPSFAMQGLDNTSKHVQSFKAFVSCPPPFFYLSSDGCFFFFLCVCVSGRCTGLLSVVSTGACACPTIHLCPLGRVLSQLSFSPHSSVTVFFSVPCVKCMSARLFSVSKLSLCQKAATFIHPLFAQVGTC